MFKSKTAADHLKPNDGPRADAMPGENNEAGPISHIQIKLLPKGIFHVQSHAADGTVQEKYHANHASMMAAVHDQTSTPHLPMLGSGARFSSLKSQLSSQPGVRNPGALAASIGRKKYGAQKFDALSNK